MMLVWRRCCRCVSGVPSFERLLEESEVAGDPVWGSKLGNARSM
jgi:hypothetical protein